MLVIKVTKPRFSAGFLRGENYRLRVERRVDGCFFVEFAAENGTKGLFDCLQRDKKQGGLLRRGETVTIRLNLTGG